MSIHNEQPARIRGSQCRRGSKYCYESPLNMFKKSLEELTNLASDIVRGNDLRLTRGMLQKLNRSNATGTSSKKSLSNSVILINDSDSETESVKENDNETNDSDRNNTSVSIIECFSEPSSSVPQKRKLKTVEQNRSVKRPAIIQLDNDSSVFHMSDMKDSLLNESNIAPTQTEDDVVELWSCLKDSNIKKDKKNAKSDHKIFKIDKSRNLKYLNYLRTDVKLAEKRKRIQDLSSNKTRCKLSKQKTLKCSDISNQGKNQHDNNLKCSYISSKKKKQLYSKIVDNLDLSSTHIQQKNNKKKINSNKKRTQIDSTPKLREIIIDGCNVAMAHTNGKKFSEKGIQIVIDYFKSRGHVVKVFLPQHVRKKDHEYLEQLYKKGIVVFTPSRTIDGRQITSYDDRFILKYATLCGGIVISSDQYRDLYEERPEWRNTIRNRLLVPTFVGDYIMFPEDPLGRSGPNLETFLRH